LFLTTIAATVFSLTLLLSISRSGARLNSGSLLLPSVPSVCGNMPNLASDAPLGPVEAEAQNEHLRWMREAMKMVRSSKA
jgi:hypothetical protein